MTPDKIKQAVVEAQCKVLDNAWDFMYALLPEQGQRGRDLADAVVTFEVAMENLKEVLRGERSLGNHHKGKSCPLHGQTDFSMFGCQECMAAKKTPVVQCKICCVALYDEAAKVGYCAAHEPKGEPSRPATSLEICAALAARKIKPIHPQNQIEITKPIIVTCQCGTTFNVEHIPACPKCFGPAPVEDMACGECSRHGPFGGRSCPGCVAEADIQSQGVFQGILGAICGTCGQKYKYNLKYCPFCSAETPKKNPALDLPPSPV